MRGERMLLPGGALPRDGRSSRALLLLGAMVLLLIVGLLGMHAIGSSASGHGAGAAAAAPAADGTGQGTGHRAAAAQVPGVQAAGAQAVGHAAMPAQQPIGHGAAQPAPPPSEGGAPVAPEREHPMLMACVLALLAGLIVLARPAPVHRLRLAVALRPATSLQPRAARAGLPPPSLTLLSISRR